MATLTSKQRKGMPASKFAGPKGHFPIEDKAHVAAAESRERFATPAEKAKINAAAKKDFPKGKKGGMVAARKSK